MHFFLEEPIGSVSSAALSIIENVMKIVQLYLEPHMIRIKVNRLHSPLPTLQQTSASSSSACFSPQMITQIFTGNCYCSPLSLLPFLLVFTHEGKQRLCVIYVFNCETKVATQLLNPFAGVILWVTFWSWIRVFYLTAFDIRVERLFDRPNYLFFHL